LLPALLGLFTLPGCDDVYNVEILYPLRKDWIITAEKFDFNPPNFNPPGLFPLDALDGKGGLEAFAPDLIKARDANQIIDPKTLNDQEKHDLMIALRDLAGRPKNPKIDINDPAYDELNRKLQTELHLDRKTLTEGSKLFRKNCLHCHGLTGDGRGPTGKWLNPPPRDYRQGAFKFTSSSQGEGERKPRREDLRRVITNGIDGTSMPSFHLLPPEEIDALISYVTHLSIRGEAEMEAVKAIIREKSAGAAEEGTAPMPVYERVRVAASVAATRWLAAQTAEIKPESVRTYKDEAERLAAAKRGYEFFMRADQCSQCHTNIGRDSEYRYDAWGTVVKPRNFLLNTFRGGRRPIDLYWRIHSGIKGAGMPPMVANPAELKEKEGTIWDLIAFLQIVPYPEERAKLRQPPYNVTID
jgi:mono/diheme cytochrome c family protein